MPPKCKNSNTRKLVFKLLIKFCDIFDEMQTSLPNEANKNI